ncbi:MAG: glycosyltransferase family 39 protein [Cyanobacteriota bacterium]|nr:glycosyltransferase family 39 protein [Cyanobacteriota bacterium]
MVNLGWQRFSSRIPVPWRLGILLGGLATLSLLIGQGIPALFDWDELIYGSLARHMLRTGHWWELHINDLPFWEKPPLFFWLQALSMGVGGVNPTAARLPNALAGGLLVGLLVGVAAHLGSTRLAWCWGILMGGSLLPMLFGKTGLIDPLLNSLMLGGLLGLFGWEQARLHQKKADHYLYLGAILLGLAMLTKGPLGILLPLVIWGLYKIWHRDPWMTWGEGLRFSLVVGGVALSWFVVEWLLAGPTFVWQFIRYQWRILTTSDGHGGPIYFHLLAYSLGCFPFAWLTWQGMQDPWIAQENQDSQAARRFSHLLLVAFGVVLGLFSLVVQTKLIHYTSLLYPLGSYFAARRCQRCLEQGSRLTRLETLGTLLSGGLIGCLLLLLAWVGQHRELVKTWIGDPLTQAYLSAPVSWPGYVYWPGIILLIGLGVSGLGWNTSNGARRSRRWLLLLLATWLSGQLIWGTLISRVLLHTQGGSMAFFQSFASVDSRSSPPYPVALYGFRSFIPYFYGPDQVPYSEQLWSLIPLVENGWVEHVVTWQPFVAELQARLPLTSQAEWGGVVLLKNQVIWTETLETTQPPPLTLPHPKP